AWRIPKEAWNFHDRIMAWTVAQQTIEVGCANTTRIPGTVKGNPDGAECGSGSKASSLAIVFLPTAPSEVRLCCCWKACTRAVVSAPKMPSGTPNRLVE